MMLFLLCSLVLAVVLAVVGGEMDQMLEVDMYGSRPGESLVVPASNDYYKYVEMSDGVESSTAQSGPGSGTTSPARQMRTQARHRQDLAGSCYTCSTLQDKTGLCQDISAYISRRQNNETGLPVFEAVCAERTPYCQVMRVDYKVDNMSGYAQWSLERSCSETCEPFCVTMGGRTKVTYCTSCCRWDGLTRDGEGRWEAGLRADNCNVGNIGLTPVPGPAGLTSLLSYLGLLRVNRL